MSRPLRRERASSRPARLLFLLAALMLLACGARAQSHTFALYTQPTTASLKDYQYWMSSTDASGAGAKCYDDFRLGFQATIQSVTWEGCFFDQNGGGVPDDAAYAGAWRIEIHADNNGSPGPEIFAEEVPWYYVYSQSLGRLTYGLPHFEMQYSLNAPFEAQPNVRYWLSISYKRDSLYPAFALVESPHHDGEYSIQQSLPEGVTTQRGNLNFGLTGQYSGAEGIFVVSNVEDSGPGSLRQAIEDANATPEPNVITFSIGDGYQRIDPQTPLPDITSPVIVDGSSQPGYQYYPLIEIAGEGLSDGNGLNLRAPGSVVASLVINRFPGDGINVSGDGGNRIAGCFIGTDASSYYALPNGRCGVRLSDSFYNVVGFYDDYTPYCVISGNPESGIATNSTGDIIASCAIGTDLSGSYPVSNGYGIDAGGDLTRIGVYSDNYNGNYIGGNLGRGVSISGSRVTVSYNALYGFGYVGNNEGVTVGDGTSQDCRIEGNSFYYNQGPGVAVFGEARNLSIVGNYFYSNRVGVVVSGVTDQRIAGNYFLGNEEGGVIISGLTSDGKPCARIALTRNSMEGNGLVGIDLDNDGFTPNDPGDGDDGANGRQNAPVITSVARGRFVTGTLNSKPNRAYAIEVFADPSMNDSGLSQGYYVGSTRVVTDANGNANFACLTQNYIDGYQFITATATDAEGNTSEFSPPLNRPKLAITDVSALTRQGGQISLSVTVGNSGITPAANVRLDSTALGSASAQGSLPSLGTIPVGDSRSVTLTFPDTAGTAGKSVFLKLRGLFDVGSFTANRRVTLP